ncbi:MAG: hypothetical protein HOP17_09330 [Acidobacteria bacterium]|nr:hypothetical protein [Acidobacteriota bacterium]
MIRIILGVIVGFVVWSILWVGSDQVLINASKDWYGAHQFGLEKAMYNGEPFVADTTILIVGLLRSVIFSLMAGFLAAFIANENSKAPFALGVVLLLVGIGVQVAVWKYIPIWYHFLFLFLLIPVTVAGGRLRSRTDVGS